MLDPVYRTAAFLCQLVARLPIGTNLGMAHLLWTLISGHLLSSRGAVFAALSDAGVADTEARRSEAALREGKGTIKALLRRFRLLVQREKQAKEVTVGGWHPLLIDWVGFFRPRLADCRSKHYDSVAGRELPALEFGMVAAVRQVGERQIPLLLDTNRTGDTLALVQLAKQQQQGYDVLVADRQVKVSHLQQAGVRHFVIRAAQNLTARRSEVAIAAPGKRGRKPTQGQIVRPLPRHYRDRVLAATLPDREETFMVAGRALRAQWFDKVRATGCDLMVSCLVIHDPRYANAWLLVTDLGHVSAETVYLLYCSRWKIEQLPLTGKQVLGGHRSFVHAATSRYRLPEICLLCASVSLYLSATCAAVATGFWDRCPKRTPGRYRRVLSAAPLPVFGELAVGAGRVREKRSVQEHLPKGRAAHCRRAKGKTDTAVTGK